MTFFEPDPPLPDPEAELRDPRHEPPTDELPAVAPESIVLASTEHVVVALTHVRVFSDGVEFALERRYRRGDMSRAEFQRFVDGDRFADGADHAARLRFGVLLADGHAVAADRWFAPEDPAPEGHTLLRGGGGGSGSDSRYAMTEHLWLHPLPPPGPIELVVQWPAVGIPETRATVDGDAVLARVPDVRHLWRTSPVRTRVTRAARRRRGPWNGTGPPRPRSPRRARRVRR